MTVRLPEAFSVEAPSSVTAPVEVSRDHCIIIGTVDGDHNILGGAINGLNRKGFGQGVTRTQGLNCAV